MEDVAVEKLGWCGAMISASKSGYNKENPNNLVIFNANVCTEDQKIWYGDIDMSLPERMKALKELALELETTVYVLYEFDGRFENEGKPLINKAVLQVNPDQTFQSQLDYVDCTTHLPFIIRK